MSLPTAAEELNAHYLLEARTASGDSVAEGFAPRSKSPPCRLALTGTSVRAETRSIKTKPPGISEPGGQSFVTVGWDQAAFLRRPASQIPPRPVRRSGRAAGTGMAEVATEKLKLP